MFLIEVLLFLYTDTIKSMAGNEQDIVCVDDNEQNNCGQDFSEVMFFVYTFFTLLFSNIYF